MSDITGTDDGETLAGGTANDTINGLGGNDDLFGNGGDDALTGGAGDDNISGGQGIDSVYFDLGSDGTDRVNLGAGYDVAYISGGSGGSSQVRLTFTSAEVGNDDAADSGTLPGQDGALAVRLQAEGAEDSLTGGVSRYDDEGTAFLSDGSFTFDVRDLVSGAQRGDGFGLVFLGTAAADNINYSDLSVSAYVNLGAGNDVITTGSGNDFLVGGVGNDRLVGGAGDDSFIGGLGKDAISGGAGNDTLYFNTATDGTDRANLGVGTDQVIVSAAEGTTQIRLTFTSSEVGNNDAADSGTGVGQDGKLAVRLQVEGAEDSLTGGVARFDDEGIFFTSATPGVTFDVRDLVSGTQRGDTFVYVGLGTSGDDVADASAITGDAYGNGGGGNDTITTGTGADFLVGGAGDDILDGGAGADQLLGGAGADTFAFGDIAGRKDTILDFVSGTDKIDLSAFDITADDVKIASVGDNTQLRIDVDGNGTIDFRIAVVGADVAASDLVF